MAIPLWAAAGFLAGVLAGIPLSLPFAAVLAAMLLAGAYRTRGSWPSAVLVIVAFAALGCLRASHASPELGGLPRLNGTTVQLAGVVAEEPDIRDSGANYTIAVTGNQTSGRSLDGRVAVHTSRAVVLEYGDRVEISGRLTAPRDNAQLPYGTILRRRGIGSTMRFPRILDLGPSDTGWAGWIAALRRDLENGIDRWLPEPAAALLIAIALGARSATLGDLAAPLVATGLIHIIAISGIKVAMVAGTAYEFLRRLPSRLATLASALTLLFLYVMLTGHTVSGERSAIMWGLVFVAAYLGRGTVSWLSLLLVAAVMAAVQPGLVWDPAFQMTALGTASIVAFTDRLLTYFRRLPSPFREAFCVTVAAQAGTLPVVIASFHILSAWGPVANALVLPLLPALIVLGFLLGAIASLPAAAAVLAALAYALIQIVLDTASGLASLPGAVPIGGITTAVTLAYFVLLGYLSHRVLKGVNWVPPGRRPGNARELAFGVTVGAALVTGNLLPSHDPGSRLTWLGTGEALLLQSSSKTVLIDGSPRPLQLLQALGKTLGLQRSIDVVIVTDPRSNVAGLLEVLRHYTVGEVLDTGCEYPTATYARWRAALRARGIPRFALRTGTTFRVGSTGISALGPDALYGTPQDSIGLLRVEMPDRRLLLIGSASAREQTEAVFRPVSLKADVLVMDRGVSPPAGFLRHVAARRLVRLDIRTRDGHIRTVSHDP